MCFIEFETTSYYNVGRNGSAATEKVRDITSKSDKVLLGNCSICNTTKPVTVSDNTVAAERTQPRFLQGS